MHSDFGDINSRPPARGHRLASLFRWVRTDQPPVDDTTLLAPYRRSAPTWRARLALYLVLAAFFTFYGFLHGLTAPFQTLPLILPLAALVFIIVWALPPGEYAPWRALEPLFLAYFAAAVIWPKYLAISLPNLPWITLVRLFSTPLTIILLVCVSTSRNFRDYMGRIMGSDPWIWKIMTCWVILQTGSIPISWDPGISFSRFFQYQFNWTAIFFTACFLFSRPGFAHRWAFMFLTLCYVFCFYGLWENKLGLLPWAGHIPKFLRIEDESVIRLLAGVVRSVKGIHRVQSISSTPLGLSELLGLAAPFALHFAIGAYKLPVRIFAALFLPLALQLVLLSDSRLGSVALLGAVLGYVFILSLINWRRNTHSLIAPALVLSYPAIFTVTIMATFLIGRIRNRVWGGGAEQASNESRSTQWEMGIPKILDHPLGHGIGGAARNLGYIQQGGILTIDSYYLTLLMDLGFLGLIVYFSMFLRGAYISVRSAALFKAEGELTLLLPMSVALMNFVVVKSVFSQDDNHPIVFMILGGVIALTYRATQLLKTEASVSVQADRTATRAGLRPAVARSIHR